MRVLIDGDGCPVVALAVRVAKAAGVPVTIFCDTAHSICHEGAETITVSKGADSVDFALIKMLEHGDVVITQDFGLAAMCLAKGAVAINQNGQEYTDANIDAMLGARHLAREMRAAGRRIKGPTKREKRQDEQFAMQFTALLHRLL